MLTSKTWQVKEEDGVEYLTIPSFSRSGLVRHCFTTSRGGFSPEPYGMIPAMYCVTMRGSRMF